MRGVNWLVTSHRLSLGLLGNFVVLAAQLALGRARNKRSFSFYRIFVRKDPNLSHRLYFLLCQGATHRI